MYWFDAYEDSYAQPGIAFLVIICLLSQIKRTLVTTFDPCNCFENFTFKILFSNSEE